MTLTLTTAALALAAATALLHRRRIGQTTFTCTPRP